MAVNQAPGKDNMPATMSEAEKKQKVALAWARFHLAGCNETERQREEGLFCFWASVALAVFALTLDWHVEGQDWKRASSFALSVACVLAWTSATKRMRHIPPSGLVDGAVIAWATAFLSWFLYKLFLWIDSLAVR